jgi:hypothetical protein
MFTKMHPSERPIAFLQPSTLSGHFRWDIWNFSISAHDSALRHIASMVKKLRLVNADSTPKPKGPPTGMSRASIAKPLRHDYHCTSFFKACRTDSVVCREASPLD